MNQTTFLSRSLLKDKARGALNGHYSKFILAFFILSCINLAATFAIEYILSLFLGLGAAFSLLSSGVNTAGMSAADIATLEQDILAASNSPSTQAVSQSIFYLLSFVVSIFIYIMNIGFIMMFMELASGRPFRISDLFTGFKHHFSTCFHLSLRMTLIQQLVVLPQTVLLFFTNYTQNASAVAIILLLLIPCYMIYAVLSLSYSQSCYLHLDFPDYSCNQIMGYSRKIMKGHKLRLFWLELSFFPLLLLCALTLGVGNLWLTAYQQMTLVFFYLNLIENTRASNV